jgi:hypothetical protein
MFAAVLAIAALAVPASASADPFQLTNWSPPRPAPDYYAGTYHASATNPKNGRILAFGYNYDGSNPSYFSAVFKSNGSPVGGVNTWDPNADPGQTYGAAYNPVTGGWVVSYIGQSEDSAMAQFLNADGTLDGAPIELSTTPVTVCCQTTAIAYQSKSKRFLFAWTDYVSSGKPVGRFVSASGTVQGSNDFDLMSAPDDLQWNDYHSLAIDYSPKQDKFGLIVRTYPIGGGNPRPWFQLLGKNGAPSGNQRMLSSNGDQAAGNPDIAYNAARDEFGVVWTDSDETDKPRMLQRINASNGASVGSPTAQDSIPATPGSSTPFGVRTKIVAHPSADQYYLTTIGGWDDGSSYTRAITGWKADGDGTQNTASLRWLMAPPTYTEVVRPQVTFSPADCSYLVTVTGSADGNASWNLYANKIEAQSPCGSASKPFLKAKGNGGTDSLKVKVGCSGSGSCRIRLTGKLKGGSGKLVKRTVKVKAGKKSTVVLDYSDSLRQQLASRGGGKIRVTAKEIGGSSSSATVHVPQSVTG